MERLNENKIICHVIGLNPSDKEEINKLCKSVKKYNLIDLDNINNEILNSEEMNKMFKTYSSLKKNKNDKYKDVDKKMTKYWEDNMIKKVYNLIPVKKKSILIGKNHHYRLISKKIDFKVSNRFILDNNIKNEVKNKIKYNLITHQDEIVNGTFPVEYLDYKYQMNKIKNLHESYIKIGYTKINLQELLDMLMMHANNKIKGKGLWISLNEPYNIGSKIHPNKKQIFGYIDPVLSLIGSFNFNDNDIDYNFKEDRVVKLNKGNVKKMNKGRYLYYVSKEDFMIADSKNKHKYISHNPVVVLEKEKISNVLQKLRELNLIE